MPELPTVHLVGAGPGHPGLLTLRGREVLAQADLVLYDRLVPESFLDHAPANAERICITELSEHHTERYQPVKELLFAAARAGKRAVRLKGGDPFLFGRGAEEAEELRAAGIPFEIVPGVTAALGVAACAGIPLTHRDHNSSVAFLTGHETPGKPDSFLDWEALARFPGTLVVYMGLTRLAQIARTLMDSGMNAATPAAAVQWGSTNQQVVVQGVLHDLAERVADRGLTSPVLIIIGSVVALRERLEWFERRPLFGRRVLVTRPRGQTTEMVQSLEELGAIPLLLPTVEIRDPADWNPVDAVIERLASFQWLVFTSVNGVHHFVKRLRHQGRDLRALGSLRLAAIGPSTADALRGYHLDPDVVPATYRSEDLAAALLEPVRGQRVLLARADRGRDLLREQLATVAEVEQFAVYSQVDTMKFDAAVVEALRRGDVDFVLLTSSNIARAFARLLDTESRRWIAEGRTRVISISPVTSAAIREVGLSVAGEATNYTGPGVIEALLRAAGKISVVPTLADWGR